MIMEFNPCIPKEYAKPFVYQFAHLSRRHIETSLYIHGAMTQNLMGEILALVCYAMPPAPELAIGIGGIENRDKVLYISTNCRNPAAPGNIMSWLFSQSFRWLRQNTPYRYIVAYALPEVGYGATYQAANFLYTGLSALRTEYLPDATMLNTRGLPTAQKTSKGNGMIRRTRPRKPRYVAVLGAPLERNNYLKALRYPILPYPKCI